MMEWSTDTKTGYDDLEVYMEYGYVFVSSTGRNHVKIVAFSFNIFLVPNMIIKPLQGVTVLQTLTNIVVK